MQSLSHETLHAFARSLLSLERPHKLKPEDQHKPFRSHLDELNHYVHKLIPKTAGNEKLLKTGQPLDKSSLMLMLVVLSNKRYINQTLGLQDKQIVALLSTGATMLAITSYLHELPFHYAAVSEDYSRAIIPQLDDDKDIVIIDDVVGNQVNKVYEELSRRGHNKIERKGLVKTF